MLKYTLHVSANQSGQGMRFLGVASFFFDVFSGHPLTVSQFATKSGSAKNDNPFVFIIN